MLLDQLMSMMEKLARELQDAPSEKRDHFLKSSLILFDISLETLKRSPELREKFAQVHSEFLRHPESRDTIIQGIRAYNTYVKSQE